MGKVKKLKAFRKLNSKEQRWMADQDHKVSRQIVNFMKTSDVSTIQLEELSDIRQTARTQRTSIAEV